MKAANESKILSDGKKTKLSEVFSLFCSSETLRPIMQKPFIVGSKTYATDAYTMVFCDSDKIDFEFENKEKPLNVEGVIPKINTKEIINLDSIDWDLYMNKDETIGDGNDVECGHCRGEGTYQDNVYYKNKFYDYEYECPVCDGSGYEEEEKQIPTGNKTFDRFDKVKFKEHVFNAEKFYKLKKVKDLINSEIELVSYNSNLGGSTLFKIDFLYVLLMPCANSDEDYLIANIN